MRGASQERPMMTAGPTPSRDIRPVARGRPDIGSQTVRQLDSQTVSLTHYCSHRSEALRSVLITLRPGAREDGAEDIPTVIIETVNGNRDSPVLT